MAPGANEEPGTQNGLVMVQFGSVAGLTHLVLGYQVMCFHADEQGLLSDLVFTVRASMYQVGIFL